MNFEVVLTCAVTGAGDTVGKSSHVPVTPAAIANAAIEAARAGASAVHLHVRDPKTGKGSRDPALFRETVDRVRQSGVDVVINLTAGMGGDWTPSRARLAALLPAIAAVSNPLDYTTPIWGDPARTGPVFAEAMDLTRAAAAVLVQDYPAPGLDESRIYYRNDAGAFIAAAKARGLPSAILATLPENIDPATRDWLVDQGCTPLLGIAEGLAAMRGAIWWGTRQRAILSDTPAPLPAPLAGLLRGLTEAESKALLAAHGLAVPQSRLTDAAGMVEAVKDLTFPLALKMIGRRLLMAWMPPPDGIAMCQCDDC